MNAAEEPEGKVRAAAPDADRDESEAGNRADGGPRLLAGTAWRRFYPHAGMVLTPTSTADASSGGGGANTGDKTADANSGGVGANTVDSTAGAATDDGAGNNTEHPQFSLHRGPPA
jgi:hypothetical protein